ncbi:hypothetical protein EMN47_12940 [Prolixibacteraceae bacterium JC049]|nr:hypothetical protein [Prolixibacteraceae bacterium JC049]
MGHQSIAVIKEQIPLESADINKKDSYRFKYLVLEDNSIIKFFDYKSNVLGDNFNYTDFKNRIINFFNLPQTNDENEIIDFEVPPRLFKSSKNDPYATSYEYILSRLQVDAIEKNITSTKKSNYKWLTEEEINANKANWDPSQAFIFEKEKPFQTPKFSNKLRESLIRIVQANKNGKLVIFTGAGISYDSGVPCWRELINELKTGLDNKEGNFLDIAQEYYDTRGKKEYNLRVQEILKHGITRNNPIHNKIVKLHPHHIISTNYDTHFEQVFEQKNSQYSIVKKDTDLPYSVGSSLFVKMHGDFDERNIVLKKKDYEEYSSNFPLIEGFVKGIFASKLVLFIGFSFTDKNLTQITNSVNDILKEDNQPPYIFITPEKDNKDYQRNKRELEKKGLIVVEYEESSIDDYFAGIASDEEKEQLYKLGDIGKKVYKFLKTLEDFDTFSLILHNSNIENQLINSFLRFKELGAIPINVIKNIPPLRLPQKSKYEIDTSANYNFPTIETLNEDLLSFLNKIKGDNDTIDISPISDIQTDLTNDVNSALNLLFNSGVYQIRRKNDTTPEYITVKQKETKECTCPSCLYKNYRIDELLNNLNTTNAKVICQNDNIISIKEAWAYLKTGQIIKAFFALEDIKSKSWKHQKYIIYFISCYNQKILLPFLDYFNIRDVKTNTLEEVKAKINKIDLNRIIYELPLEKCIREALIEIKDNRLYDSTKSVIKRNLETIKDNYHKYQKGNYYSVGPTYWYESETAFYILYNFYSKNCLFNDNYYYFKNLANQYLESMICSYSTDEEYQQRLNSFSGFFIHTLIEYGDPKKITLYINKYNLNNFRFQENDKMIENIMDSFTSFIMSGYKINSYFSRNVSKNQLYNRALEDSLFLKNNILQSFNNFFILFTKIELNKSQINNILEHILDYLEVNSIFDYSTPTLYLSNFIISNIKIIDDRNTTRILKLTISSEGGLNKLIEPVCNAFINTNEITQILDNDFYEQLIKINDKRKISPFFLLLKKEQQKKCYTFLKPLLKENEFAKHAHSWGVWHYEENSSIFETYVENLLKITIKYPDFEISNDGFPKKIGNFSPWNQLHFYVDLIYKNKVFNSSSIDLVYNNINSQMFKWILKPDIFEYSQFKSNWILAFNNKHILSQLKSNNQLLESIKKQLSLNYNEYIARIYFEELL